MLSKGTLHLSSADAVAGDVDDVIHAAGDGDQAVLVTAAAVSSEVVPLRHMTRQSNNSARLAACITLQNAGLHKCKEYFLKGAIHPASKRCNHVGTSHLKMGRNARACKPNEPCSLLVANKDS